MEGNYHSVSYKEAGLIQCMGHKSWPRGFCFSVGFVGGWETAVQCASLSFTRRTQLRMVSCVLDSSQIYCSAVDLIVCCSIQIHFIVTFSVQLCFLPFFLLSVCLYVCMYVHR